MLSSSPCQVSTKERPGWRRRREYLQIWSRKRSRIWLIISDPKKGRHSLRVVCRLTLEDPAIDTKETYTFKEKRTLVLAGIKSDVYHVSVLSKG